MSWFKQTIKEKKQALKARTAETMAALAKKCVPVWSDAERLDHVLQEGISQLADCHLIYAVNTRGILISSNVEADHLDKQWRGDDVSGRPYLESTLPYQGFTISQVYISRQTMEPCITVMQPVRENNKALGFIAADFNVEDLRTRKEPRVDDSGWKQYKGDPAIRGTLFMQERVHSAMDKRLDDVIDIITDLMQHHGIFHCKIHFSSSRASFWSMDDPYVYSIHTVDEIINPDRCLAFPRQPLPARAQMDEDEISLALNLFKALRNADETVYLRSSSINIINGMIGLTFSCDGSHYIHYREFLNMATDFWFGSNPNKKTAATTD